MQVPEAFRPYSTSSNLQLPSEFKVVPVPVDEPLVLPNNSTVKGQLPVQSILDSCTYLQEQRVVSYSYVRLTQCLVEAGAISESLPEGWGIRRFPCTR